MEYALEGVKVVELATFVACPTATRIMSDFGAEVIKVEAPQGDLLREVGVGHMLPIEDGNNPLFDISNSGKKLIALDLKKAEGMEIMKKLLSEADVFASNIRISSLEKMGLGYEQLHEEFPDLVYAHFSGFGLEGVESGVPGFDTTAFWMRSGAMLDTVTPGSFPIRAPFGFGDITSASHFLNGILMALYAKDRGKGGSMVKTSLLNTGMWCSMSYILNSQEKYGKQYPFPRHEPWDPFSDYYQCADGEWVGFIEKLYAQDKGIFAEIFGLTELETDPDLETLITMRDSGKTHVISEKVAEIMLTKTSDEWVRIFREKDIPAERLRHYREASRDPQALANGFIEEVDYGDGEPTRVPVAPMDLSEYDRKSFSVPGRAGADGEEILKELGYSDAEIEKMKESGAFVI